MKGLSLGLRWMGFWPSAPDAQEGAWVVLEGRPVFRLQISTANKPRGIGLLDQLSERYEKEIQAAQPGAVIVGTARGEMEHFLHLYEGWKAGEKVSPLASPETTAGTFSSYIARKVGISGPAYTVSQTCLSGLLALYQAALLIQSGEVESVLFGAVEVPLHPFFVESMAALRIYSHRQDFPYVRPGGGENTMAIGEAVALGILTRGDAPFSLTHIALGTAPVEPTKAFTAVSTEALLQFLRKEGGEEPPDWIMLHAPGTRQGDAAEWEAIRRLWGEVPVLSVKAFVGHSLGAAPLVSLGWALHLLSTRTWPSLSYPTIWPSFPPTKWREVVLIALGFGGVMGVLRLRTSPKLDGRPSEKD